MHFKGKSRAWFLSARPRPKLDILDFSGGERASPSPAGVGGRGRGSCSALFAPFRCAVAFPLPRVIQIMRETRAGPGRRDAPVAVAGAAPRRRAGVRLPNARPSRKVLFLKIFLLILDDYRTSLSVGRRRGVSEIKARPCNRGC